MDQNITQHYKGLRLQEYNYALVWSEWGKSLLFAGKSDIARTHVQENQGPLVIFLHSEFLRTKYIGKNEANMPNARGMGAVHIQYVLVDYLKCLASKQ